MKPPPPLSQQETIELLLERSGRPGHFPIRNSFLEIRRGKERRPGPFAALIARRDERALQLFLLVHAVTSSDKQSGAFDVTEWATTWARTLGLFAEASGATAVSRVWKRLAADVLITRRRGSLRRTNITVLSEDGSGDPYTAPSGAKSDPYFKVPFAYWTDEKAWYRTLSLPARAVLLIALSREPRFYLPHNQAATWYGVSEDTIRQGLHELQDHKLLSADEVLYIPSLTSPTGWTPRTFYRLQGAFEKATRGPDELSAEPPATEASA